MGEAKQKIIFFVLLLSFLLVIAVALAGIPAVPDAPPDSDGDGYFDFEDNCPKNANPSQADADFDAMGNACDNDADNDGILNDKDNCPHEFQKKFTAGTKEAQMALPDKDQNGCLDVGDTSILFRGRKFNPLPGLDPALKPSPAAVPAPSEKVYAYLQVHKFPTKQERAALANRNVTLFGYLPRNAYFASIPKIYLGAVANLSFVRAVAATEPVDKVDPLLRQRGAHKLNQVNNSVKLNILFFNDTSHEKIQQTLAAVNGTVIAKLKHRKLVVANVPKADFNKTITTLGNLPDVLWVEEAPYNFGADNNNVRTELRVDNIKAPEYGTPPTGLGVVVAEWDVGWVDNNNAAHPDLTGRVFPGNDVSGNTFGSYGIRDHSTHVAGTVLGNGANTFNNRGMAPGATLVFYQFWADVDEMNTEYDDSLSNFDAHIFTNSWFFGTDSGAYTTEALEIDAYANSAGANTPMTWSAGNTRNDDGGCDLSLSGAATPQFDCLTEPHAAKNIITVGAVNSDDNSMTAFSSWGPTNDGRIKPDVVAGGCQNGGDQGVTSTVPNAFFTDSDGDGNDDFVFPYGVMCGTSMATPAVAGVLALMREARVQAIGIGDAAISYWKAALIQTAWDLARSGSGQIADADGPDFKHGWGLVNAEAATDLVFLDSGGEDLMQPFSMTDGEIDETTFEVVPGTHQFKITAAWTDDAPSCTNVDEVLVNDIDIVALAPSGGVVYGPWTLDFDAGQMNGGAADRDLGGLTADADTNAEIFALLDSDEAAGLFDFDHKNNVEQIYVENPEPGTWKLLLRASVPDDGSELVSVAMPFTFVGCDIDLKNSVGFYKSLNCSASAGITPNGAGSGIRVNGDETDGINGPEDMMIDCKGFQMIGNGSGIAIDLQNVNNVTIKNCIFNNWGTAIQVDDSEDVHILGNTITNSVYGVRMEDSEFVEISGNAITGGSDASLGIWSDGSNNVTVYNNTVSNVVNGTGMNFRTGSGGAGNRGNIIDFNRVINAKIGIAVTYGGAIAFSEGNKITNNIITASTAVVNPTAGMYINYGLRTRVKDNVLSGTGIYALSSLNSTFISNTIINASRQTGTMDGLSLIDSSENTLIENVIVNSSGDGINLDESNNNYLELNEVCGSGWAGSGVDIQKTGGVPLGTVGIENSCDTASGWNDDDETGCTYTCACLNLSAAVDADNNFFMNNNTKLCPATYVLPDMDFPNTTGVIIYNGSVKLLMNGANLTGDESGVGIFNNFSDTKARRGTVRDYLIGMEVVDASDDAFIKELSFVSNNIDVRAFSSEVTLNDMSAFISPLSVVANGSSIFMNDGFISGHELGLSTFFSDGRIDRNLFCSNAQDIVMGGDSAIKGDLNTCDTAINYTDESVPAGDTGCYFDAPVACILPSDGIVDCGTLDSDGDFVPDACDPCPADPTNLCDVGESTTISVFPTDPIGGGTTGGGIVITGEPGSVEDNTTIGITKVYPKLTDLINGLLIVSNVYELTPENQTFLKPIQVIIRFDPAPINNINNVRAFRKSGPSVHALQTTIKGDSASFSVTKFSQYFVAEILDTTSPQVKILQPKDGATYLSKQLPPVEFIANDPEVNGVASGIQKIEWALDGNMVADPNSSLRGLICGKHTLMLKATDVAQNVNVTSNTFAVTFDNKKLAVTPNVLKLTDGVLTVHMKLAEQGINATLLNATIDGVPVQRVVGENFKILRKSLDAALSAKGQKLDTHFEIEGFMKHGGQVCKFVGSADIAKIETTAGSNGNNGQGKKGNETTYIKK